MAQKKAKRSSGKRNAKRTVTRARKAVASRAKRTATKAGKAAAGTKKAAKSGISKAAKSVKKVASNPKRTVRKAADNVHQTAGKTRDLGQTVIQAGEALTQAADFVDSMAMRAKARTEQSAAPRGRKR